MAATLYLDSVHSAKFCNRWLRGNTAEVVAVATDVPGDTALAKLAAALCLPGLPALGSVVSAPSGAAYGWGTLTLVERRPEYQSDGSIRITLVYQQNVDYGGNPNYAKITLSTEVGQEQSDTDVNGSLVLLRYQYPTFRYMDGTDTDVDGGSKKKDVNYPPGDMVDKGSWAFSLRGSLQSLPVIYQKERSNLVLTISRNEVFSGDGSPYGGTYASPLELVGHFKDTLNPTGWALDPTARAGMWRMMSIGCEGQYGGLMWTMTYVMKWKASGWRIRDYYTRPWDGKVPSSEGESSGTPTPTTKQAFTLPPIGTGQQHGNGSVEFDAFAVASWNDLALPVLGPNPPQVN